MLRHRVTANNRRKNKGLSILPWGPNFSHVRSNEIYFRSQGEGLTDGELLPSYDSFQLNPVLHHSITSMPMQTGETNNANISTPAENTTQQNQSQPIHHTEDQHMEYLETGRYDSTSHLEHEIHHSTGATLEGGNVVNSSFNEYIDVTNDTSENDISSTEDQPVEPVIGVRSRDAFMEWAWKYKEWIDLYIDFGISSVLFQCMLRLLEAPYHCKTVKRNVIKYSKFRSILYIVCRSHMLLCRRPETTSGQQLNAFSSSCEVCNHSGTSPDLTTFEYLPIRDRLIQWYESEESFPIISCYRRNRLAEKMTENETTYEDYFDGDLFKSILHQLGGRAATEYDLFIGISADGFQAFERGLYDCWPIVAINLNLNPSIRFLLKNLIPLGYIKGPADPDRLDTFFVPLIDEVSKINDENGVKVLCGDGIQRSIRVHVLWITSDKAARVKLAATCGHNGRCPCETCEIEGYWLSQSKHYYYPSKILERTRSGNMWTIKFQIDDLPKRTIDSIEEVWAQLDRSNRTISNTAKGNITVRTGIKPKTSLYSLLTIRPFTSFPHDSMHHIMNVTKDLFEIWKGENRHLNNTNESTYYPFVLQSVTWKELDKELQSFSKGTNAELFGPIPRSTSLWKCYKASECRDFFLNYAVILFSGRLSNQYLEGVFYFSRIVELCCRTVLTAEDINDLKFFSIRFYEHFERYYYCYEVQRVGLMKSTIHSFLHLHEYVRLYGPFTNFNQYWIERKIGSIKKKLHSTNLVAESMTEQTKLEESFKILFNSHFQLSSNSTFNNSETIRRITIGERVLSISVGKKENINDSVNVAYRTKSLLTSYMMNKGFSSLEIQNALSNEQIYSHNQIDISSNVSTQRIGA